MNIPFADTLLETWVKGRARARGGVAPIESLDLAKVQRVLMVLTTGLGDAVLSTPVFPALRAALPRARIGLFVRAGWAPLFEGDPDLDTVISYHGKYRQFLATMRSLRGFAPQLAVVLHGNDPDILPMLYLAGSRYIVRIPTQGTRYRELLANAGRAQDAQPVPGLHYIDNRLRILDTLGIVGIGAAVASPPRAPRIHVSPTARASAVALAGSSRYWVYHAFAADAYKVWPASFSRTLLERAHAQFGDHAIVLTGAPGERGALQALAHGLARARVLAGAAALAETAGVLAGAACVVAPDTGVLHLAAALDRPVVGLYAPTSAQLVGPRAARARSLVIQKPQTCDPCVEKRCPYASGDAERHCMRQITVDEVISALGRQLGAT